MLTKEQEKRMKENYILQLSFEQGEKSVCSLLTGPDYEVLKSCIPAKIIEMCTETEGEILINMVAMKGDEYVDSDEFLIMATNKEVSLIFDNEQEKF